MRPRSFPFCALAVLLLVASLSARPTSAVDRPESPLRKVSKQKAVETRETVSVKTIENEERVGASLPRKGVLVAVVRWGETTLGVFDVSNRQMISLAKKPTGPLVFSQEASRLAYLVREGVNPAKNHVEILDWRLGRAFALKPATDYALLGFALHPVGKTLVYAALNIRTSRTTDVTWRLGVADLERQETRVTLTSSAKKVAEGAIPVPFEWSRRTGRVYLQGWLPFRGMIKQSIWSANPEVNELTQVIPEPAYIGVPRLSSDASKLLYLTVDPDILPPNYVAPPGPPPGNVLSVMDLASGEQTPWTRAAKRAFGAHAWSASGEDILVVEQDWLKGRFRDVEIRRIGKTATTSIGKIDQSSSLKEITGLVECPGQEMLWVEKEGLSARLHGKSERNSAVLFEVADGTIELLGCFNR